MKLSSLLARSATVALNPSRVTASGSPSRSGERAFASAFPITRMALPVVALALASAAALTGSLAGCAKSTKAQPTTAAADKAAASTLDFPVNHTDWSKIGYRLDWVGYPFPKSKGRTVVHSAVVGNNLVFIDSISQISLLDSLTGERRWGQGLANPLTRFVGVVPDPNDAGRVIVCTQSEAFWLSAATGELVAKEGFEKVINTKPLVVNSYLVSGTTQGEITAHYAGQDVKAWGIMTSGSIEVPPVRFTSGSIGSVSQLGDVVIVNERGQMLGRNKILGPLATNPVTDGNYLFIAGTDQSVWAFTQSGGLLWRYRTASPLTWKIATMGDSVYTYIPKQGLTALEANTGKVRWIAKNVRGDVIAVRDGKLVVDTKDGIDLLDPVNGAVVHSILTPGIVKYYPEPGDDATLYAVSNTNTIAKFIPKQ